MKKIQVRILGLLILATLLVGLAVWWANASGASGLEPAAERLASPTLALTENEPEEESAVEEALYLPLVITHSLSSTHHTRYRPTNVYLSRRGNTYEEALGAPVELRPELRTTGAWNSPPNAYHPYYTLTRGFFCYDLGELTGRTVISAALDLRLCAARTPINAPITLTLHAGTWDDAVTPETWEQIGEEWGTVTVPPYYDLPEEERWLPLPLSGPLPSRLRLVWKTAEQPYPDGLTVGAAFDLADCYGVGLEDEELTTLHLWIAHDDE